MSSNVPFLSLRDAGVKLIDCVHKTPAAAEQGFPYIAIPQLVDGRVDVDGARRISEQDMVDWNVKCDPQEGDVVLSRRCNPGVTAVIPKGFRGSLGQNLVLLRATNTDRLTPKYLRWAARGREWWNEVDKYINVGAVFESLRCADIPEFAIPVPSIAEQEAIAHTLDTLDDKIELNRKTNETLEAVAKALFKSWFVDFDPVRAKAEGRPTGLPAELSDLFPDSFEDSELVEIPSGWEIKGLDEVADFLNGLALQKYPPEEGIPTLPVIKIAQLKKGDSAGADQCSSSLPGEYVVRDGDVLFSWSGSLAVDIWCGGKGALNQHLFKVTSKSYSKWFFYHWVKHHLPDFQEIAKSKATTMGHIQRHHLSAAKAVIPSPSLRSAVDSAFEPLLKRSFELRCQSRELSAIRDALLPRLISGELRIPDAEKLLAEAGV